MKNRALLISLFLLFLFVISPTNARAGYYKHTCPHADKIVRTLVARAMAKHRRMGAALIRLQFHDCFVRGCDASVLLDPTPKNPHPEKLAPINIGLAGFDVIDRIKSRLEKFCPGVVSCADIIAFAARDASEILNGIRYNVTGGRLDGKVSCANEAQQNLPPPEFDLEKLKDLFVTKKNLTVEDLVVLSGAHTVGVSHCSSFSNRLYPKLDPTLDSKFATRNLTKQCPKYSNVDGLVNLDYVTPFALDSQYYNNVLARRALFFSDWSLLTSNETLKLVKQYATTPGDWEADFAVSMPKLSMLDWITNPSEGEIRRNCRVVNY